MNVKNVNEKLKCFKSTAEIKFVNDVRKGKEELRNCLLRKEMQFCINGKRIFYPTKYHAYF